MDKLRNSTQWSIGPSTPWQLTVIKWGCWSRVFSWWWFFWFTITWNFILQTLKILKDAYTSRIVRVLSRERLKAMKALYALYAKYANVLVEKRTLVEKSKIWNLKSNYIYSMQSIEQHYSCETEEQNSTMNANCLWRKTPCWIHLMPRSVATITIQMIIIPRSERWILSLFSL